MTTYETFIASIAATNLLITLAVMLSNRSKAAATKVDEMGAALKDAIEAIDSSFEQRLHDQALRIERLDSHAASAPKHEDLAAIYTQLNATRQQVERLAGEMDQMNANLRLMLNQLMKTL
ncbi:MAG: hypothetical protein RLY71_448 [Pseudomonadota bacterium]|jgi:ubiquinone biosynthesis protein UbiJ